MTPSLPPDDLPTVRRMPCGGWDSYREWAANGFKDRAEADDLPAPPRTGVDVQAGSRKPKRSQKFRLTLNDDLTKPDGKRLACVLLPAREVRRTLDTVVDGGSHSAVENESLELVRPYLHSTTKQATHCVLQLETVVSSARLSSDADHRSLSGEHQRIRDLCRLPQSVAELAAALNVPFPRTQELISSAHELGLLTIHTPATTSVSGRPTLAVLRRVHEGLRKLA